jgi:predicted nucleic acid-binding protein
MAARAAGHQEGVSSSAAVFDASPLIVFHQVGHFDLLRGLFRQIVVPTAVAQEVAPSLGQLPSWVQERAVLSVPALPGKLDDGEREAIALTVQLSADFIALDDLPARRAAAGLGLTVIGSLGLLVRAKDHGLIREVRPTMDEMISTGLYASERLYHEILEAAGEVDRQQSERARWTDL